MGAHHAHDVLDGHDFVPRPGIERRLWVAVGVWAALTVLGLVVLWPSHGSGSDAPAQRTVHGSVVAIAIAPCTGTAVEDLVECRVLTIQLDSGPDAGQQTRLEQGITSGKARVPEVGDDLILTADPAGDGTWIYNFADYERSSSMFVLTLLFVFAVVILGGWRGLGALTGLAVSIVVLVAFVLPALLVGSNPVVVAIVGASVIAFASLYLAHGFNSPTNVALLSTLAALALTGFLAWVFIELTTLTGLSDENAAFLDSLGVHLDPRGLLLAGVVIGSLGVLDDVTVTQVSAVSELHRSRPDAGFQDLYRSALRIGRDHISSTVNTLFLAYAGAALPLLLLFTQVRQSITTTATQEVVAVEIVRTLVGSIGLIASVPIATGMAAALLVARPARDVVTPTGDGDAASAAAV